MPGLPRTIEASRMGAPFAFLGAIIGFRGPIRGLRVFESVVSERTAESEICQCVKFSSYDKKGPAKARIRN